MAVVKPVTVSLSADDEVGCGFRTVFKAYNGPITVSVSARPIVHEDRSVSNRLSLATTRPRAGTCSSMPTMTSGTEFE